MEWERSMSWVSENKKICELQMGIKYENRNDAVLALMANSPALR